MPLFGMLMNIIISRPKYFNIDYRPTGVLPLNEDFAN
jgi:hypothetical protein